MIRNATSEDRIKLVHVFLLLLKDAKDQGYFFSMAPTMENAELFYTLYLEKAIAEGDPVLIAEDDQGRLQGAAFYILVRSPFTLIAQMASGHGTYVRPQYRKLGISKALRAVAEDQLRAKGVLIVEGAVAVANEAGMASVAKDGFFEAAKVVRKLL